MEGSKKYFVGGNWKSNGTTKFLKEMIEDVLNKMEYNRDKVGMYHQFNILIIYYRGLHCSSVHSFTNCETDT